MPSVAEQHSFLDAAKAYQFDKVKELIIQDAGYVNASPSGRWTALHQAAQAGDISVIKWLLQHGADRGVVCGRRTARMVAAEHYGDHECAKLLEPDKGTKRAREGEGGGAASSSQDASESKQPLQPLQPLEPALVLLSGDLSAPVSLAACQFSDFLTACTAGEASPARIKVASGLNDPHP